MKSLFQFLALAVTTTMVGCGTKEMTPEEIYNRQASGVVMVLHQYYYSVELGSENTLYFSGISDGQLDDIAFDEDSIIKSTAFGTAFFIDEKGGLITNRHVVDPSSIALNDVKLCVKDLIETIIEVAYYTSRQKLDEILAINQQIKNNTFYDYDEHGRVYQTELEVNDVLRKRTETLAHEWADLTREADLLEKINYDDIIIHTHSEISIAYHDTYVTSPSDFKPCVVVKTDQDADLALIRLKDKTTPEGRFVFKLPDENVDKLSRKELSLNQQLVLIGYNNGVQLAATDEGIKAQLTTGNVSQQPDDNRVMYTIPVLPGSSGSPVLNSLGDLVAVNFAGVNGTQSFNFGIPLKRLEHFMQQ